MGNLRCKWVRDRLPLLVGDELRGLDRRGVERHLIGCPQCRQQRASLGEALEALRTVAATAAAPPDAPSLWPALARQIRESRRPVPTPTFTAPLAWILAWPRANPWPVLGLGLGLGLLATIGVSLGVRQHVAVPPRAHIAANPSPRPILRAPAAPRPRSVPEPDPRPDSRRDQGIPLENPVVENPSPPASPRYDREFDLDHGRPMPLDSREARDTKNINTH